MKMKYVVAIVLLGIAAYIGITFLISGIKAKIQSVGVPVDYEIPLSEGNCAGMRVSGELEHVLGKFGTAETDLRAFGLGLLTPVKEYYYMIQIGYSEEIKDQKYAAIVFRSEDDVKLAEQITVYAPQPKNSGGSDSPRLKFKGYVEEMDVDTYNKFRVHLMSTTYLTERIIPGMEYNSFVTAKYNKYIIEYVIRVQYDDGSENFSIALGAAGCAVGIGGIILVFIRIKRDKSGYD